MSIIEKIKNNITCIQVAQALGLNIRKHGDRCKSFRTNATNPISLCIYTNYWVDYGNGNKGGDCIELWKQVKNITTGDAIREIIRYFGVQFEGNIKRISSKITNYYKMLEDANEIYHKNVQRDYWYRRGFTDETIDNFKLGYGVNAKLTDKFSKTLVKDSGINNHYQRQTIPYIEYGRVKNIISRGDKPKFYKLKSNEEIIDYHIFGINSIKPDTEEVWLVESETDTMSLIQEGHSSIAIGSLKPNIEIIKKIAKITKEKKVIICLDKEKGKDRIANAIEIAKMTIKAGIDTEIAELESDEDKIDFNSMLVKYREIILPDSFNAFEVMIDRIKRKRELEKLLRLLAENVNDAEAKRIIRYAENLKIKNIDKKWVKDYYKMCKELSEEHIIKKLVENKNTIYIPKDDFFQYNEINSLWETKDEEILGQQIMKVAPNTITGSKIRSITHLAKVVVAREDIVFNYQKEKFNLKNGKIDIETTKFEKRTETDYCTICTDYDYDKDAKTEEIEKFLFDIANGDSRRIRLLKQLMGYCLTKDIEYHKAFILYGKGRNGKSVFLQMLTDMVGEKNVANIPIHGLDDAFQLINIRNKMINISTEVNADKNDGTDVFKKVVAGDPVMACKKNKDFIEFKPFAKLIFATNKIMTARETTDGYMDRLIIIDFQSKYVTNPNPQKPHEKKIIENYYDKYIKNNITGALIVALDGLIDLRTEGGFYETLENKQHKEDIKRTANPIYAFVYDKNLIDKERSLEDLYETYAAWCSVSGSGRMSMRRFQMELQETFNFRKLENISYIPGEKELWKITD